jgi:copper chaperone NosL
MGAPETVPFASLAAAQAFALTEGGKVLELSSITDEMVLTPVEQEPGGENNDDYKGRLRALPNSVGG